MKKCSLIFISALMMSLVCNSFAQEQVGDIYRVYVATREQVESLIKHDVDIVATNYGRSIDIRCSKEKADSIASVGLRIELVMTAAKAAAAMEVSEGFHDYEETKAFLEQMAALYPSITVLDSIGRSIENRALWALKISDNPSVDEDEPCFLVEGCIHGNEHHSLEVCLYFIRYLLENYGTDPEVTYWVDNREIWVVPLVNPDGHELNQRYSANGIDLNRNFGYWWGFTASRYGTAPFSEPETQAIRDLALAIRPYGSFAFHTSGRVILYPWAYISTLVSPDDALFIETGSELIDSINTVDPQRQYELRRSGSWYWHGGEHNDWMYSQHGMLSFTLELMTSQSAPPSERENEVVLPSFRVILRRPDRSGITGLITDATTGEPLTATVKIVEIFDEQIQPRTPEPLYGRYIRCLTPGTHTLEVYFPGYRKEIRQITVNEGDPMQTIDFQMVRAADIVYFTSMVDDDMSGLSQGDGNGLFNRGETIEFGVSAKNIGTSGVQNVYGILSTDSQYMTITQDSLFFGNIDSLSSAVGLDNFIVTISSGILPGRKIEMHIDFYDDAGTHWESSFYERIQGFFDNMDIEGREQWTHGFVEGASNTQDDWQYGAPNGESTDPSYAYSLDFIWGNDLGEGNWNGSFQSNVHNYLQMRTLDCSGWNEVYLQYYRWLDVSSGDRAYISVNDQVVWENYNAAISETKWALQTVDISSAAGGQDSVVIRFGLQSDEYGTNGGWNIDDVLVHNEAIFTGVNNPPAILTTLLRDAFADEVYLDTLVVIDPDIGDVLTVVLLSGPDWLSIELQDGLFILTGTPTIDDIGFIIPVSIRVEDSGGLFDIFNTTIDVYREKITPDEFRLYQNYPNPFNSGTRITFDLPEPQYITLAIYNILGQKVKTLVSASFPAGTHSFIWQGDNTHGEKAAGGVYFMRLTGQNQQITRKLLMVR